MTFLDAGPSVTTNCRFSILGRSRSVMGAGNGGGGLRMTLRGIDRGTPIFWGTSIWAGSRGITWGISSKLLPEEAAQAQGVT